MKRSNILQLAGLGFIVGLIALGSLSLAQSGSDLGHTHDPNCSGDAYDSADRKALDGATLAPYAPNKCHNKIVFTRYSSDFYYRTNNGGNSPWSDWYVHCPAGSGLEQHGRAHWNFSPTVNHLYDAMSHYFCVGSDGRMIDPIPGPTDEWKEHTGKNPALSKVEVVDTGAVYYYAKEPTKIGFSASSTNWVGCPGGAVGPIPQISSTLNLAYDFSNHFICKNPGYDLNSADKNNHNPGAGPVDAMATAPSSNLVGGGFSTQSSILNRPTDTFLDQGPWEQAPIGTVMCVSTQSGKVYYSSTGTCPSATSFPASAVNSLTIGAWANSSSMSMPKTSGIADTLTFTNSSSAAITYTFGMQYSSNLPSGSCTVNTVSSGQWTPITAYNLNVPANGSAILGISCSLSNVSAPATVTYTVSGSGDFISKGSTTQSVSVTEAAVTTDTTTTDTTTTDTTTTDTTTTDTTTTDTTTTDTTTTDTTTTDTATTDTTATDTTTTDTTTTDTTTSTTPGYTPPEGSSCASTNGRGCINRGFEVEYTGSEWCYNSSAYYMRGGGINYIKCFGWEDPKPESNYKTCSPNDSGCVEPGAYGKISGSWCTNAKMCYKKGATDETEAGSLFCQPYPNSGTFGGPAAATYEDPSCPSGYSTCSPTDRSCRSVGDSWTISDDSLYCSNSRKCTLASGGGTCVGNNESCPSGSTYCRADEANCGEPGEYVDVRQDQYGSTYVHCGYGGMTFYSKDGKRGYCPSVNESGNSQGGMMMSGKTIKSILSKLGTDWGLCSSNNDNGYGRCLEPGETGKRQDWCGWWPPEYADPVMNNPDSNAPRTCPKLDEKIIPQPVERPAAPGEEPGLVTPTQPQLHVFRECGLNEVPNNAPNSCSYSSYKWDISNKQFVQCTDAEERSQTAEYRNIQGDESASFTSCKRFHTLEKEWRRDRYLARNPITYGEYYMPAWDAATKMYRYDLAGDNLTACTIRHTSAIINIQPCMPVPDTDRDWMLKMFRINNRLVALYEPFVAADEIPSLPVTTVNPLSINTTNNGEVAVPLIADKFCRSYLKDLRLNLVDSKLYYKSVSRQVRRIGSEFENAELVEDILESAREKISNIERLLRDNSCKEETLKSILTELDDLHNDLFPELSLFSADVQERMDYAMCSARLHKHVDALLNIGDASDIDAEVVAASNDLAEKINEELDDLAENTGTFDATFQCIEFEDDIESKILPLLRQGNADLNRLVEENMRPKLASVLKKLETQLEENGRSVDDLLIKIGQLHTAIDKLGQAAEQMSERITVSLSALSRIDEKFTEERAKIQEVKDTLVPRVEAAINALEEARCVTGNVQERLVGKLTNVAAVNWIGDEGDSVVRRIELFTAGCAESDVTGEDVDQIVAELEKAEVENQKQSYERGLTPFKDVPIHEWYYGSMLTGHETGFITQGRPAEAVLRQDALLMVLRSTGASDKEIEGDCEIRGTVKVSDYAKCAVGVAAARGLDLPEDLQAPTNRLEVAMWIDTLGKDVLPKSADANLENLEAYVDIEGLDIGELNPISRMIANEIMVGNVGAAQSAFRPYDPLTRAALSVILEKLLGLTRQNLGL